MYKSKRLKLDETLTIPVPISKQLRHYAKLKRKDKTNPWADSCGRPAEKTEFRVKRGAERRCAGAMWAANNSVYRPGAILYLLHNDTFTPQSVLGFITPADRQKFFGKLLKKFNNRFLISVGVDVTKEIQKIIKIQQFRGN